jgi:TonB-like protein
MIPRTLVPVKLSPVEKQAPSQNGHRRSSLLDTRTVVPTDLPAAPLDPRTSIPAHLPLDVLASRMLIPRDMPVKPMEPSISQIPTHVPLAVLETRVVVPAEARLDETFQPPTELHPSRFVDEVLERDLFTTGEVNLLASPEDVKQRDWQWVARSFSLIVHVGVLLLILFLPKLFVANQPSQEVALARQRLSTVFLPPEVRNVPKVRPPIEAPSNRIRLDPRILKKLEPVQPPTPPPMAGPKTPAPPQPAETKPAAPQPAPPQPTPAQKAENAFKPLSQMVQPPPPKHKLNLDLPPLSPGKALEESARQALRDNNSSTSAAFAAPMPQAPGGPPPSGQGGQGLLGSGVQILTPTNGVDFSNYLTRLLARVKQNWESVMPISARMGEKGVVMMRFQIMRNGDMPNGQPALERTSGKEPLDSAAGAALRESNPFEPLPSAFTGPYIELRIIFLYNLPLDYNINQ